MLITDLAGLLRIRAPEAPSLMLQRVLRESARQFFRESRAWRLDFGGVIVAGTDSYDLTLPAGALAHDVIYAKLTTSNTLLEYLRDAGKAYVLPDDVTVGNTTKHITLIDNNTFQLLPVPYTADVIEMKVILTLDRAATAIDDQIVEEYEDALIDGALARLYEQPNKTWTDLKLAMLHHNKFAGGIARAKSRAEEARTPGVRSTSFSW